MEPQRIGPLGSLQARLLRELWRRERACVGELLAGLEADAAADLRTLPAYVTVLTVMRRLERRGLVGHAKEGKRFIYFPRVTLSETRAALVRDLADALFGDMHELKAFVRELK